MRASELRPQAKVQRVTPLSRPGNGALFTAPQGESHSPFETELLRQVVGLLQRVEWLELRLDGLEGRRRDS